MQMTCKSAELTRFRGAFSACETVVPKKQEIWIMVFDPVINRRPKPWSGRLENVIL
jgi:hypothetical protein